MLLKEMSAPLLFGVALFSLLTIATVVLQDAARFVAGWGGGISVFFKILLLASPMFIVLSIPMGVLLGTLLSVGRLSSDLEIVALRALGVGLYRVLLPYFVVGIFFSAVTFAGYELLVPWCNSQLTNLKNNIKTGKDVSASRERESWTIYDNETGKLKWLLVAAQIDGPYLEDVYLLHFDPKNSDNDYLIMAEHAEWDDRNWAFYNYKQVFLRETTTDDQRGIVEFDVIRIQDFDILPESLQRRGKKPEDLTAIQLKSLIRDKLANGEYKQDDTAILELQTMYYQRFAVPLTPLVFIIIAIPLAIRPQRSTSMIGFGMALLIVLVYYVLYSAGQKLGSAGVVEPWIAAWAPNIIPIAIGILLLRKRERQ